MNKAAAGKMESNGRTLFVILGMARSGTSAISRAMRVYGAKHGTQQLDADETNPAGFWEDVEVLAINEELLAANGGRWDRPGFVFNHDTVNYEKPRALAKHFLETAASRTERFAVKEPRMTRLLDFWQPLFEETGWDCRYILALRNPISVADSLYRLKKISGVQAALLWAEYMIHAIRFTNGKIRILLDYDRLIANPEDTLRSVGKALGVGDYDPVEMRAYCDSFLASEHRHAMHNLNEVYSSPDIPPSVIKLYSDLLRCTNGELDLDDPVIITSIDRLHGLWQELVPIWRWLAQLNDETERYATRIAAGEGDLTWARWHLAAKDDRIEQLTRQNLELTQTVTTREFEISERLKVLSARDNEISELTQHLTTLNGQIFSQSNKLADFQAELDRRQELLAARDASIMRITSSKSWRLTSPLRQIQARLIRFRRSKAS